MPTLAIDVMSGDLGATECVPGALLALARSPDLRVELVGSPEAIEPLLGAADAALRARLAIVPAADVVPMDELPRAAIRHRKHSSMRIAVDRVKEGAAVGCVSAGNTGALTAIAHFVLKTVPEVERAPIMSALPAAHGHTYMLDLGANISASAVQLCQFAMMGSIVARDVYGVAEPRVGLLNIGEEDIKGHDTVQSANALIAASGVRYLGFIEGDDIFSGEVDVVVTDGFTGNVALKSMEGLARLITDTMRAEFTRSALSRAAALVARPVLKRVGLALDPRRYNGACMVGLRGVVVKSHGRADRTAFARAIELTRTAALHDLPGCVARALGAQPPQGS
ncbi:MAG TPA: phosphate acyltransferase PlsX [Steroidobacteraceae bacterium]|nr:phosphate acyltransferase PlsX [Steroidobacteraceae bacterium]HNS26826.1 phosphate acyltransferase PlsX [Steroidobacteraceae bacterium]